MLIVFFGLGYCSLSFTAIVIRRLSMRSTGLVLPGTIKCLGLCFDLLARVGISNNKDLFYMKFLYMHSFNIIQDEALQRHSQH
jgi:hypothetical protein